MSVLSDDQIGDILDICNVCASSSQAKELIEWNKKQKPDNQFEPDWSKAPQWAETAIVMIKWVGVGNLENFILARHERPEPVITPHPHAEIMMKYAEVAARRVDPWVEFEFRCTPNEKWEKINSDMYFYKENEYRYIGEQ